MDINTETARLRTNLELLFLKWSSEWVEHVTNNDQPTRDDEREHLLELKKVINNGMYEIVV